MATVTTPVSGFDGEVAGVTFVDGKGTTEDPRALAYFKRQGYGIGSAKPAPTEEDLPDPRDLTSVQAGTELRDAAVDPEPEDFLAPTNAGEPGPEGNPHGPDVVSPEVHSSQRVRPVHGGPVAQDTDEQDADEKAHTLDIAPPEQVDVAPDGTEAAVAGDPPAKSANKPDWVDFAVASGLDRSTAEAMTKAELVDAYGPKG